MNITRLPVIGHISHIFSERDQRIVCGYTMDNAIIGYPWVLRQEA